MTDDCQNFIILSAEWKKVSNEIIKNCGNKFKFKFLLFIYRFSSYFLIVHSFSVSIFLLRHSLILFLSYSLLLSFSSRKKTIKVKRKSWKTERKLCSKIIKIFQYIQEERKKNWSIIAIQDDRYMYQIRGTYMQLLYNLERFFSSISNGPINLFSLQRFIIDNNNDDDDDELHLLNILYDDFCFIHWHIISSQSDWILITQSIT